MKRKLFRGLALCTGAFPLLFVVRLLYGFTLTEGASPSLSLIDQVNDSSLSNNNAALFNETRKNYASSKYGHSQAGVAPASVDQKYEKVATLRAETQRFDEDEAKLRASIKRHEAMIQFEQAHGLAGRRQLRLSIGVPPERFEPMLEEVRRIGTTVEIQVDKADKTNEYQNLNAQRASLEKARSSLASLKGHGGAIDEQINLENKILEIEEQIQKLGVRLGEFDAENEFVTIHFTLQDRPAPVAQHISFAYRVRTALHWAMFAYVGLLGLLFIASLSILMIVVILEKLKWIPAALRKID